MGFAHWNVPHISLTPARGGSHRKDVGRILFWKRTRPTPRKKSTRAFRLRPGPPTTRRARAAALSLWKPSPGDGGRRGGPRLWKPLPETRDGAGKINPQGDEGRETRIKQKTDRVVHSEAERTRVEIRRFGFPPRCAPHSQMRGYADLIFGYSAAGRQLPDLVDSS